MSIKSTVGKLSSGAKVRLVAGVILFVAGVSDLSWPLVLVGLGLLASFAWSFWKIYEVNRELEPFPMPADIRATAEAMARPIDPTPRRALPPDEKSLEIAQVATTKDALADLIEKKPPAWRWAVFTSVIVQRRNAVQDRLHAVASGYQPRPGRTPISGPEYLLVARDAMLRSADLMPQLEQFLLSPGFKGAFGEGQSDEDAHADAIVSVANRLMDYHEDFLEQAETCLQTPVQGDVMVFVADAGLLALCPLVGFERFIVEMCARIGQAQDLLPYTSPETVIALDDVTLTMDAPDALGDRVLTHIRRFAS
jgi:hypothetical protein